MILLTVALVGAVAVHLFFHLPLWLCLLIFFVGWPFVGTLMTIDDDLPGGFSNPDGSVRPPWLQRPFLGQIIAGIAISIAGLAIDVGWRSRQGILCWVVAASVTLMAAALFRRK